MQHQAAGVAQSKLGGGARGSAHTVADFEAGFQRSRQPLAERRCEVSIDLALLRFELGQLLGVATSREHQQGHEDAVVPAPQQRIQGVCPKSTLTITTPCFSTLTARR